MPSSHDNDEHDYDYDDYGVDEENIPNANDKTSAAIAAALSLSNKKEQELLKRKRRQIPKIDFERYHLCCCLCQLIWLD